MRNIVVPELGESVVEARIARWLKKEGDSVAVGEPLVELETEKIDLEVNADSGGVIASIKRKEGEDVKIGELLAVVDETVRSSAQPSSGNGSATASSNAPGSSEPAPAADQQRATPTARRVAQEHDVNLASVSGSGSGGRVMKADVKEALGTKGAPAASAGLTARALVRVFPPRLPSSVVVLSSLPSVRLAARSAVQAWLPSRRFRLAVPRRQVRSRRGHRGRRRSSRRRPPGGRCS